MTQTVTTAMITGAAAIGGGLVTVLGQMMAARIAERQQLNRERRQRARKRIQILYDPLIKKLTPPPPYDDDPSDNDWFDAAKFIEKNRKYATPDLIAIQFEYQQAHYEQAGYERLQKAGHSMQKQAHREYMELARLCGYGDILRKRPFHIRVRERGRDWLKPKMDKWSLSLARAKSKIRRWKRTFRHK